MTAHSCREVPEGKALGDLKSSGSMYYARRRRSALHASDMQISNHSIIHLS